MTAYIDREKLKRDLIDNKSFYPAIVKNAIENTPTEDVVPRSLFDAYKREVEDTLERLNTINEDKIKVEVFLAKQEVAKQIFEEIHKEIRLALDSNYTARTEHIAKWKIVDKEFLSLVDGKISALRGIEDFLAELKKKYIGE